MFKLRGMKQTVNGEGSAATAAIPTTSTAALSSMESDMTTTIATTYSSSSAKKCQDKDLQPPNQKPIYIVTTEKENTVSRRFVPWLSCSITHSSRLLVKRLKRFPSKCFFSLYQSLYLLFSCPSRLGKRRKEFRNCRATFFEQFFLLPYYSFPLSLSISLF